MSEAPLYMASGRVGGDERFLNFSEDFASEEIRIALPPSARVKVPAARVTFLLLLLYYSRA
jgi:hypothetical protein